MPKLPKPSEIPNIFDHITRGVDSASRVIDTISKGIDKIGNALGEPESSPTSTTNPASTATPPATTGTACIPCCRDHLSTSSSALSEGIRFAREKGVKDPEALRRIRIALDELNIMERIDLAPDEIVNLKGAEKELADWTLKQSRDLRHAITAIKDVETMEQAAARGSQATEEFMGRLWAIPEEECETCGDIRERLAEFIEKRKRERAGIKT